MKRLAPAATALLLIALAAPAAASAQRQPGNLTLNGPKTVKFGQGATLSGKLTGRNNEGRTITLREDPFQFGVFVNSGTAQTDAQGDYSFLPMPSVNTRYQTRVGSEESRQITVTVLPKVTLAVSDRTPRAGRRVRFSGRVCPQHDGAALKVQRRARNGKWRTVAGTTLADIPGVDCSSYSRRVRVRRDGAYRTFLAEHGDHGAGNSRAKRLNVH
jgi:hypothetical protein